MRTLVEKLAPKSLWLDGDSFHYSLKNKKDILLLLFIQINRYIARKLRLKHNKR